MMTRILLAAVLVVPSALQAANQRPSRPASRPSLRSTAAVAHKIPTPRELKGVVAQISSTVASDPTLTARPSAVSQEARDQAIRAAIAQNMRSLRPSSRAAGGRGWSGGFSKLGVQGAGSFTARRADDPTPAPSADPGPPYLYTPGALIRTEGLGYKATPTNDARWQTEAQGYAIYQDPNQSTLLNPFPGIHVGPADKLPPPNPTAGNASGRNAITPNSVAFSDSGGSTGSYDHNRDQGGKPDDPNGHGNGNGN